MKKIMLALVAITMTLTAFAQDGKSLYLKYSDLQGVQAVYISPAMFRMIGRIPDMEVGEDNVNVAPIIQSMNGFYLLSTEDPNIAKDLYAEADKYVKKGKYELMLEAKDDGDATRIYTVGTEDIVTGFVMLARDGTETSFIAIDGKMQRDKLEDIIAGAAK